MHGSEQSLTETYRRFYNKISSYLKDKRKVVMYQDYEIYQMYVGWLTVLGCGGMAIATFARLAIPTRRGWRVLHVVYLVLFLNLLVYACQSGWHDAFSLTRVYLYTYPAALAMNRTLNFAEDNIVPCFEEPLKATK